MEIPLIFAFGFRMKPFGIENPPPNLMGFFGKIRFAVAFCFRFKGSENGLKFQRVLSEIP